MSKIRLASILALACCIVAGALPLAAQTAPDGAGVSVDLGGSAVLHRTGISYPASALAKGVEGTVVAQVTLDASGNVTDARVLSGPDELRKVVLQSVLQWHFTREAANGMRQVSVTFQAPEPTGQQALRGDFSSVPGGLRAGIVAGVPGAGRTPMTVKSIQAYGLPDQARAELLASLPVHVGDTLTPEAMVRIAAAARQYDEHLSVQTEGSGSEADVLIVAPGAAMSRQPSAAAAVRVTQAQPALIRQIPPVYPPLAKQARIQGTVVMNATIARDGTVQNLTMVSGHPLLAQAAMDAVRQWVYQPTLLNGEPVGVETEIDVNYTLAK